MQEFEVGSYVWFVRSDKPGVRHYLVVEEIVKRSIDGVSRDYLFEGVSGGKTGRIESRQLIGDYFVEREEAYNFMLKQAGEAIAKMMDRATYPVQTDAKPVNDNLSSLPENIEPADQDGMIVELPDGTKARLKGGIPK